MKQLSIETLPNSKDTHIASFEVPNEIKNLMDINRMNAIIDWYLNWKLTTPLDEQNTCRIKDLFGEEEAIKCIIIINLWKYLRGKGYDPDVIEKIKGL